MQETGPLTSPGTPREPSWPPFTPLLVWDIDNSNSPRGRPTYIHSGNFGARHDTLTSVGIPPTVYNYTDVGFYRALAMSSGGGGGGGGV